MTVISTGPYGLSGQSLGSTEAVQCAVSSSHMAPLNHSGFKQQERLHRGGFLTQQAALDVMWPEDLSLLCGHGEHKPGFPPFEGSTGSLQT